MQVVKGYFSKVNVDMEIRVMEPTAVSSFVMAGKSDAMTWATTSVCCGPRLTQYYSTIPSTFTTSLIITTWSLMTLYTKEVWASS